MRNFFLVKIRLSVYFWALFVIFMIISVVVPGQTYAAGALTLFSVNSFLYGFYIAPILGAQKSRIEEFHKIVRSESNNLFSLMLRTKKLPKPLRTKVQGMITDYVHAKLLHKGKDTGERQYEALIGFLVSYEGVEETVINQLLDGVVANQQNRTNFAMQVGNKVFANEWQIMAILFSITLGFILTVDIGHHPIFHVIRALLCTGLTMLIIILVKLNTLTHKKAKQMWQPLQKLIDTNFYRID